MTLHTTAAAKQKAILVGVQLPQMTEIERVVKPICGKWWLDFQLRPGEMAIFKGFAREAVSSLIKHLFNNYGNNTITAHTDTRNTASIKLLESLGFMLSEMLPNADHFKGQSSDEYIYKLTKS